MESPIMITATTFSRGYSSFWQEVAPWLNGYVVHINNAELSRCGGAVASDDHPDHKAINNLIAAIQFEMETNKLAESGEFSESQKRALSVIKYLPRSQIESYELSDLNQMVIMRQVSNLRRIYTKNIEFSPRFSGYSIISDCEADLIIGPRLIEIKAADRKVTPSDIRQLLTYLILNKLSANPIMIKRLELYNPRHARRYETSPEDLCSNISNISFSEICSHFESFIEMISIEAI